MSLHKKFVQFLVLLLVTISCGYTVAAYAANLDYKNQVQAPNTVFFDGKKSVSISDFRGKYLLVNFWATWCSPCLSEMPSLDRLAKNLSKENLVVIAISQDEGGASQVRPFLEKLKLKHLVVLYDPSKRGFRDFGLRGLPSTYLIDPSGKIVKTYEGSAEWDVGPIYSSINNVLAVSKK